MIYAIVDKLKNDTHLSTILKASSGDVKIYPLNASFDNAPCLVYNDTPVSDDGETKVDKLEIRAIDKDYDNVLEIIKTVSEVLIIKEGDPGYESNGVSIMGCVQNGGGSLKDTKNNVYEKFIYLNIEWRYL